MNTDRGPPAMFGDCWRRAILPRLVASSFSPGLGSSITCAPAGPIILTISVAADFVAEVRVAAQSLVYAPARGVFEKVADIICRSFHAPFIGLERKRAAPQSEVSGA